MDLEPGGPSSPGAPAPESADDTERPEQENRAKRKRPFWREFVAVVVLALVLAVLLKTFVVQVFSIPSGSMENTLLPGDRVLVNKLVYHMRGIARGDIVVFSGQGSWGPDTPPPPGNPVLRFFDDVKSLVGFSTPGTDYIKRVIGLPGDHVACCNANGQVTVNGVPLSEKSYLYPGDPPSEIPFNVTVPAGHLWVMGDNRSDSADSRYHTADPGAGSVPESAVVGRAFVIIWPVSRIGDLPIPATFQQPALHTATTAVLRTAGAAVTAAPDIGGASVLAVGVLAWRRRSGPPLRPKFHRIRRSGPLIGSHGRENLFSSASWRGQPAPGVTFRAQSPSRPGPAALRAAAQPSRTGKKGYPRGPVRRRHEFRKTSG
jgi:signal peptidase I